jgi:hypothetical protein
MSEIVELVNKYGFPIVMAVGMGYIIKYVWEWSTKEVKPVISEANTVLIALIDRIRMLDNDLIRLNQKVNTVLHLRGKMIESDRVMEGVKVEREATEKFQEAVSHNKKEKTEDERVVRKLRKLAAKRRLDVKRETRFLRFQAYLQRIWNSNSYNCLNS